MRAEPPSRGAAPVSDAVRSRERGLSLLSRANRWLIGLAVLLAGALTGLTAHAFHSSSTASARTRSAPSQGSGDDSGGTATAPQLQSPANPPAASPAPAPASPAPAPAPPVVSGGS